MKTYIGDAMVMLYEEYKAAKNMHHVRKPVSYALYQTWKYFDRIEKAKKVTTETYIKL